MTETLKSRISGFATLLARAAVGLVFIANGLSKAADLGGTAQGFEAMGIPLPQFSAILGATIEVGAGVALIVGFALPVAGLLLAFMMGGAYYFAHVGDPLVGGYDLPLVLGAAALAFGFSGGRYKVDRFLPWGRSRKQEETAESVPS